MPGARNLTEVKGLPDPGQGSHGPATFRMHRPGPPLDRHVTGIWVARGAVPVAAETVLPNGVVELIFNLGPAHKVVGPGGDRWYRRAWLAGMQQGPLVIASLGVSDLLGVRFRPGGAAALLDLPLRVLTDAVVEVDGLDRRDAALGQLRDQLLDADGPARIAVVETALRQRLAIARDRPDRRVDAAIARLKDAASVRDLADAIGISHKHLIDRFHAEVGVTPSRLRRILRFDGVIRALAGEPTPDWAALAAAHGFTDQPHLVREFRTFAGVTPTGFLRARLPDQAHLDASAAVGGAAPARVPARGRR